jgi:transposase
MSEKRRKHYSPAEKVAILKRHLLEQVPISKLCEEYKLEPSLFYKWQKQFFENGAAAFNQPNRTNESEIEEKVTLLEEKLARKNEVISELMEEHVKLKKELGEI